MRELVVARNNAGMWTGKQAGMAGRRSCCGATAELQRKPLAMRPAPNVADGLRYFAGTKMSIRLVALTAVEPRKAHIRDS